jgi:RimJ/RimL family protein N-acetyltransferase
VQGTVAIQRHKPAMTAEIRQIVDSDIAGFHHALDTVARERRYLLFLEAPPLEKTAAFVRGNIANLYPQRVALAQGQVVGWCDVIPLGRQALAHGGTLGMGLLPEWRGKGLGAALLHDTIEAARTFGLKRIQLGVFETNVRAAVLYRKFGFEDEGVRRKAVLIDGVFIDEIMMARVF